MNVEEEKVKTVAGLIDDMERYIRHASSSRDVNERWLCSVLEPLLRIARQVRNTNLDAEHKRAVATFRVAELDGELERKRLDLGKVERERNLVAAQAAASQ